MGHYMPDDEIIARYRWLKSPSRVTILAELNGCSCQEIQTIVGDWEMKSKMAGKDDQLTELHGTGMTDAEIAAQVGVAQSTICLWRKKMGLPPNGKVGGARVETGVTTDRSDRLILFLRGVAIGAGVFDIDEILEGIK